MAQSLKLHKSTGRFRSALAWGLLVFVGVQGLLIVLMESRFPEWRDPEYGFKRNHLRRAIADDPDRPLLVLLGSSRGALGFRPAALPAQVSEDGMEPLVFNASLMGSGPLMKLLVLRRFRLRALLPVVPVAVAVGLAMLLISALGFELTPLTTVAAPLVIAVATEFTVLLEARYRKFRNMGSDFLAVPASDESDEETRS